MRKSIVYKDHIIWDYSRRDALSGKLIKDYSIDAYSDFAGIYVCVGTHIPTIAAAKAVITRRIKEKTKRGPVWLAMPINVCDPRTMWEVVQWDADSQCYVSVAGFGALSQKEAQRLAAFQPA